MEKMFVLLAMLVHNKIRFVLLCLLGILGLSSCKDNLKEQYPKLEETTNLHTLTSIEELKEISNQSLTYIYIGKPSCPWCQMYIPYYYDMVKSTGCPLYYYDINLSKDGTGYIKINDEIDYDDSYSEFISWTVDIDNDKRLLSDYVMEDTTLDWFYVPKLLKIENNVLIDFVGTVKGHVKVDGQLPEMTASQEESLVESLVTLIRK